MNGPTDKVYLVNIALFVVIGSCSTKTKNCEMSYTRRDSVLRIKAVRERQRSYSIVELKQTEDELGQELRRERIEYFKPSPIQRARHRGSLLLHSKHVLLMVVILNLLDCFLVLGEFILDVHYVGDTLNEEQRVVRDFIRNMERRYPTQLQGHTVSEVDLMYVKLYEADCHWTDAGRSLGRQVATGGQARKIASTSPYGHDYNGHTMSSPMSSPMSIQGNTTSSTMSTQGHTTSSIMSTRGHTTSSIMSTQGHTTSSIMSTQGHTTSSIMSTRGHTTSSTMSTQGHTTSSIMSTRGHTTSSIMSTQGHTTSSIMSTRGHTTSSIMSTRGHTTSSTMSTQGHTTSSIMSTRGHTTSSTMSTQGHTTSSIMSTRDHTTSSTMSTQDQSKQMSTQSHFNASTMSTVGQSDLRNTTTQGHTDSISVSTKYHSNSMTTQGRANSRTIPPLNHTSQTPSSGTTNNPTDTSMSTNKEATKTVDGPIEQTRKESTPSHEENNHNLDNSTSTPNQTETTQTSHLTTEGNTDYSHDIENNSTAVPNSSKPSHRTTYSVNTDWTSSTKPSGHKEEESDDSGALEEEPIVGGFNTDVDSNVTVSQFQQYHMDVQGHNMVATIAHAFHKASISILAILVLETILKIVCMGKEFFHKKLEVFDGIVVVVSFILDLVFLKGFMEYPVQDGLFILSFLMPWRIIRVINSLIVAVLDHEHFRLKMIYKEKKLLEEEHRRLTGLETGWKRHLKSVEEFCEGEGVPQWKIKQHTAMKHGHSTVSAMASFALGAMINNLFLNLADEQMFHHTINRSLSHPDDDSDDKEQKEYASEENSETTSTTEDETFSCNF